MRGRAGRRISTSCLFDGKPMDWSWGRESVTTARSHVSAVINVADQFAVDERGVR
jgi:hypothetical protein